MTSLLDGSDTIYIWIKNLQKIYWPFCSIFRVGKFSLCCNSGACQSTNVSWLQQANSQQIKMWGSWRTSKPNQTKPPKTSRWNSEVWLVQVSESWSPDQTNTMAWTKRPSRPTYQAQKSKAGWKSKKISGWKINSSRELCAAPAQPFNTALTFPKVDVKWMRLYIFFPEYVERQRLSCSGREMISPPHVYLKTGRNHSFSGPIILTE